MKTISERFIDSLICQIIKLIPKVINIQYVHLDRPERAVITSKYYIGPLYKTAAHTLSGWL